MGMFDDMTWYGKYLEEQKQKQKQEQKQQLSTSTTTTTTTYAAPNNEPSKNTYPDSSYYNHSPPPSPPPSTSDIDTSVPNYIRLREHFLGSKESMQDQRDQQPQQQQQQTPPSSPTITAKPLVGKWSRVVLLRNK